VSDSDALVVMEWRYGPDLSQCGPSVEGAEALAENAYWVAECEHRMVERGLGEAYGRTLEVIMSGCVPGGPAMPSPNAAQIRTAPLPTIVKALAATIRAKEAT